MLKTFPEILTPTYGLAVDVANRKATVRPDQSFKIINTIFNVGQLTKGRSFSIPSEQNKTYHLRFTYSGNRINNYSPGEPFSFYIVDSSNPNYNGGASESEMKSLYDDMLVAKLVDSGGSITVTPFQNKGDINVIADMEVVGISTEVTSKDLIIKDNLIELNAGERGEGVSMTTAGFMINRGTAENYLIQFNDSDDSFKIGLETGLQQVATREDIPVLNSVPIWKSDKKIYRSSPNFIFEDDILKISGNILLNNSDVLVSQKRNTLTKGALLFWNTDSATVVENHSKLNWDNDTEVLYAENVKLEGGKRSAGVIDNPTEGSLLIWNATSGIITEDTKINWNVGASRLDVDGSIRVIDDEGKNNIVAVKQDVSAQGRIPYYSDIENHYAESDELVWDNPNKTLKVVSGEILLRGRKVAVRDDSLTDGRIAFFNGSTQQYTQNDNLFFDKATGRLGIKQTTPEDDVHIGNSTRNDAYISLQNSVKRWRVGVEQGSNKFLVQNQTDGLDVLEVMHNGFVRANGKLVARRAETIQTGEIAFWKDEGSNHGHYTNNPEFTWDGDTRVLRVGHHELQENQLKLGFNNSVDTPVKIQFFSTDSSNAGSRIVNASITNDGDLLTIASALVKLNGNIGVGTSAKYIFQVGAIASAAKAGYIAAIGGNLVIESASGLDSHLSLVHTSTQKSSHIYKEESRTKFSDENFYFDHVVNVEKEINVVNEDTGKEGKVTLDGNGRFYLNGKLALEKNNETLIQGAVPFFDQSVEHVSDDPTFVFDKSISELSVKNIRIGSIQVNTRTDSTVENGIGFWKSDRDHFTENLKWNDGVGKNVLEVTGSVRINNILSATIKDGMTNESISYWDGQKLVDDENLKWELAEKQLRSKLNFRTRDAYIDSRTKIGLEYSGVISGSNLNGIVKEITSSEISDWDANFNKGDSYLVKFDSVSDSKFKLVEYGKQVITENKQAYVNIGGIDFSVKSTSAVGKLSDGYQVEVLNSESHIQGYVDVKGVRFTVRDEAFEGVDSNNKKVTVTTTGRDGVKAKTDSIGGIAFEYPVKSAEGNGFRVNIESAYPSTPSIIKLTNGSNVQFSAKTAGSSTQDITVGIRASGVGLPSVYEEGRKLTIDLGASSSVAITDPIFSDVNNTLGLLNLVKIDTNGADTITTAQVNETYYIPTGGVDHLPQLKSFTTIGSAVDTNDQEHGNGIKFSANVAGEAGNKLRVVLKNTLREKAIQELDRGNGRIDLIVDYANLSVNLQDFTDKNLQHFTVTTTNDTGIASENNAYEGLTGGVDDQVNVLSDGTKSSVIVGDYRFTAKSIGLAGNNLDVIVKDEASPVTILDSEVDGVKTLAIDIGEGAPKANDINNAPSMANFTVSYVGGGVEGGLTTVGSNVTGGGVNAVAPTKTTPEVTASLEHVDYVISAKDTGENGAIGNTYDVLIVNEEQNYTVNDQERSLDINIGDKTVLAVNVGTPNSRLIVSASADTGLTIGSKTLSGGIDAKAATVLSELTAAKVVHDQYTFTALQEGTVGNTYAINVVNAVTPFSVTEEATNLIINIANDTPKQSDFASKGLSNYTVTYIGGGSETGLITVPGSLLTLANGKDEVVVNPTSEVKSSVIIGDYKVSATAHGTLGDGKTVNVVSNPPAGDIAEVKSSLIIENIKFESTKVGTLGDAQTVTIVSNPPAGDIAEVKSSLTVGQFKFESTKVGTLGDAQTLQIISTPPEADVTEVKSSLVIGDYKFEAINAVGTAGDSLQVEVVSNPPAADVSGESATLDVGDYTFTVKEQKAVGVDEYSIEIIDSADAGTMTVDQSDPKNIVIDLHGDTNTNKLGNLPVLNDFDVALKQPENVDGGFVIFSKTSFTGGVTAVDNPEPVVTLNDNGTKLTIDLQGLTAKIANLPSTTNFNITNVGTDSGLSSTQVATNLAGGVNPVDNPEPVVTITGTDNMVINLQGLTATLAQLTTIGIPVGWTITDLGTNSLLDSANLDHLIEVTNLAGGVNPVDNPEPVVTVTGTDDLVIDLQGLTANVASLGTVSGWTFTDLGSGLLTQTKTQTNLAGGVNAVDNPTPTITISETETVLTIDLQGLTAKQSDFNAFNTTSVHFKVTQDSGNGGISTTSGPHTLTGGVNYDAGSTTPASKAYIEYGGYRFEWNTAGIVGNGKTVDIKQQLEPKVQEIGNVLKINIYGEVSERPKLADFASAGLTKFAVTLNDGQSDTGVSTVTTGDKSLLGGTNYEEDTDGVVGVAASATIGNYTFTAPDTGTSYNGITVNIHKTTNALIETSDGDGKHLKVNLFYGAVKISDFTPLNHFSLALKQGVTVEPVGGLTTLTKTNLSGGVNAEYTGGAAAIHSSVTIGGYKFTSVVPGIAGDGQRVTITKTLLPVLQEVIGGDTYSDLVINVHQRNIKFADLTAQSFDKFTISYVGNIADLGKPGEIGLNASHVSSNDLVDGTDQQVELLAVGSYAKYTFGNYTFTSKVAGSAGNKYNVYIKNSAKQTVNEIVNESDAQQVDLEIDFNSVNTPISYSVLQGLLAEKVTFEVSDNETTNGVINVPTETVIFGLSGARNEVLAKKASIKVGGVIFTAKTEGTVGNGYRIEIKKSSAKLVSTSVTDNVLTIDIGNRVSVDYMTLVNTLFDVTGDGATNKITPSEVNVLPATVATEDIGIDGIPHGTINEDIDDKTLTIWVDTTGPLSETFLRSNQTMFDVVGTGGITNTNIGSYSLKNGDNGKDVFTISQVSNQITIDLGYYTRTTTDIQTCYNDYVTQQKALDSTFVALFSVSDAQEGVEGKLSTATVANGGAVQDTPYNTSGGVNSVGVGVGAQIVVRQVTDERKIKVFLANRNEADISEIQAAYTEGSPLFDVVGSGKITQDDLGLYETFGGFDNPNTTDPVDYPQYFNNKVYRSGTNRLYYTVQTDNVDKLAVVSLGNDMSFNTKVNVVKYGRLQIPQKFIVTNEGRMGLINYAPESTFHIGDGNNESLIITLDGYERWELGQDKNTGFFRLSNKGVDVLHSDMSSLRAKVNKGFFDVSDVDGTELFHVEKDWAKVNRRFIVTRPNVPVTGGLLYWDGVKYVDSSSLFWNTDTLTVPKLVNQEIKTNKIDLVDWRMRIDGGALVIEDHINTTPEMKFRVNGSTVDFSGYGFHRETKTNVGLDTTRSVEVYSGTNLEHSNIDFNFRRKDDNGVDDLYSFNVSVIGGSYGQKWRPSVMIGNGSTTGSSKLVNITEGNAGEVQTKVSFALKISDQGDVENFSLEFIKGAEGVNDKINIRFVSGLVNEIKCDMSVVERRL